MSGAGDCLDPDRLDVIDDVQLPFVSLEIPARTVLGTGKIGVDLPKQPGLRDERFETSLRAGMQEITDARKGWKPTRH